MVAAQPQTECGPGGGGRGGGSGLPHARPGERNRPDLGEGFHDVLNGLSFDCPLCGCIKHLSTRQLDERVAVNRWQAWGEACPADPEEHRKIGKRLLIDLSFADSALLGHDEPGGCVAALLHSCG